MQILTLEDLQDPESGIYTASGGSMRSIHKHFEKMDRSGVMACNPLAIVASISGTLTFNLVAALGIRGSSMGLSQLVLLPAMPLELPLMRFVLADKSVCLLSGLRIVILKVSCPFAE